MSKEIQILQSTRVIPKFSYREIVSLISKENKTFLFNHNDRQYYVNPITACSYSRKINLIMMSDPLFNEYDVPKYEGDFQLIINFFNENSIEANPDNSLFLFNVGCDLQIDTLISKSISLIPESIFLTNKNNILQNLYFSGYALDNIVDLLSANFNQIIKQKFVEKLPIHFIDLILSSPLINVDSSIMLKFLTKFFNWKENPNHILAKHLPFKAMPVNEAREYLNDYRLNFNRFPAEFLSSFQLIDGDQSSYHKIFKAEMPPMPEPEDKISPGLINQFSNYKSSDSIFTSSSVAFPTDMQENYGPEILLDNDNYQYFCTQSGNNEWLQVDFNKFKAKICGYMVRSWRGASNRVCPISWDLIGSNDGEEWSIIDHKENFDDLAYNNGCYLGEVDCVDSYRYFRFVQIESGNKGNSVLALSGFELYGKARLFH